MEDLSELFAHYLAEPRDVSSGAVLADVLDRAGDGCRAAFLRRGLDLGRANSSSQGSGPAGPDLGMLFGPESILGRLTWTIAPRPPGIVGGDFGIGWFDSIELSFNVIVERAGQLSWVGVEPIRIFQYLGFLGAMRLRQGMGNGGLLPRDLFAKDRFADHPETDPVTKIYQEEARAFARWFGRSLAMQSSLQNFRERYGTAAVDRLMPHGLWIWSGDECDFDDSLHFAFSAATLDELRWPLAQGAAAPADETDALVIARRAWTRALDCGFATEVQVGSSSAVTTTSPEPFLFDNPPSRS